MAQPVFYQTLTNMGVDPTVYYTNVSTAGGSVAAELPAPPFVAGTRAFGSDGSEFIFVQASSAINLADFVMIQVNGVSGPPGYYANSLSSTNVLSSLAVGVGATGLIVRQSVTTLPAGAFFWAQTKGQYIPCNNNGTTPLPTNTGTGGLLLYTPASAGTIAPGATL